MIDVLLFAFRDTIRGAGLGYLAATCEIMVDGHPPPRMGNEFVAVHQAGTSSDMQNALDEYFGVRLTLTRRVVVPLDRVGDQLLAANLARQTGFNRRADQLKDLLHMAWDTIGLANNYLVQWHPDADFVYGFVEPARFAGYSEPELVGGEWLASEPEATDVALKMELRFENARRMQAIATYL